MKNEKWPSVTEAADNGRVRKVAFGGMPTRTLSNAGKNNAGNYQVIVASSSGSVTSSVAMLFLPPQIQGNAGSFGVQSNFSGFNLTGISSQVVVIEASTNLAASSWVALQTNVLGTNVFYFSDPDWTNFPDDFIAPARLDFCARQAFSLSLFGKEQPT